MCSLINLYFLLSEIQISRDLTTFSESYGATILFVY